MKGKKFMKRLTAGMLVTAMVLSTAACGSSSTSSDDSSSAETEDDAEEESETETSTEEEAVETESTAASDSASATDTIILDEISTQLNDITALDPFDTTAEGSGVLWEVYEMLFQVNGFGGEMIAILADASQGEYGGYDHEEGTADYTVYLHDNIYDSAGNHITGSDVAFSYDMTYAAGQTSGWSAYESGCIEVVDDYTVIFHFTEELGMVGELQNIWARCFIVSEQAYNDSSSGLVSDACGTGPYEVVDFTVGASATITARDDYWQTDEEYLTDYQKANVTTINYKVISESAQMVIGLETGEVDVCSLDTDLIDDFMDGGSYADQFDVYQYENNQVVYMMGNCSDDSLMSDLNLRNAVYYAVDTTTLQAALGGDTVVAVVNAFGSSRFSDYNTEWDSWENYQTVTPTEDLIASYLDESSYDGEELVILSISANEKYAQIIQAMLLTYGINSSIELYDYGTYMTLLADSTEWDIAIDQAASSDYLANLWSHSMDTGNTSHGLTYNFVDDEEWQTLLDTCKTVSTHTTENMDAWWSWCVDNAYIEALAVKYVNIVYPEYMTSILMTDKNYVIYGGCTYSE